jgi:DNA end-binding protein Ku
VPVPQPRGAELRDRERDEFEKSRHVVASEADFDKVRRQSTRVIDLVQFANDSAIDPMYVDRGYYLAPDGKMARPMPSR